MIYAIRQAASRQTLVEMKSVKALDATDDGNIYTPVAAWWARDWVKGGGEHETGLYIEDGKVRYAPPEMKEG